MLPPMLPVSVVPVTSQLDPVRQKPDIPPVVPVQPGSNEQKTKCGTQFLRWQRVPDFRMGVGVWAEMMASPRTPQTMLYDLYAMELQRITLNMQMSLIHSIYKQAVECAEKMELAEAVLLQRLHQLPHPSQQPQTESPA